MKLFIVFSHYTFLFIGEQNIKLVTFDELEAYRYCFVHCNCSISSFELTSDFINQFQLNKNSDGGKDRGGNL